MAKTEKYYIGKKQYIPSESDVICSESAGDPFDILKQPCRVTLYRTKAGAYYIVRINEAGTSAEVLDEKAAFQFMDEHPAGIDTDMYDKIFGEPERG